MNRIATVLLNTAVLSYALVAPVGCRPGSDSPGAPAAGGRRPSVHVVNYPLKYFAERIGAGRIAVEFPAPADRDPAHWTPDATAVLAYQKADLILLNGAGYAKWVEHATLPSAKLVNTLAGVEDRIIIVEDAVKHSHGPGGAEHSHAGPAFTTWLDPTLAVEHARAVKDGLLRLSPDGAATFEQGFASLQRDLLELDKSIESVVARAPETPLLASHPVYQYLERRYRLNLKSVHWEPDEEPDASMLAELGELLQGHPAKWMLWEGAPLDASIEKLKALGVGSVVFSPCANVPDTGDFLSVMKENAKGLERVFPKS